MKRRNFFGTLFGMAIAPLAIVKVLSIPITPTTRKLKATWSVELEQDLQNFHGIDMQSEFNRIASHEIQREIDRDMLETLMRNA